MEGATVTTINTSTRLAETIAARRATAELRKEIQRQKHDKEIEKNLREDPGFVRLNGNFVWGISPQTFVESRESRKQRLAQIPLEPDRAEIRHQKETRTREAIKYFGIWPQG